MPKELTLHKTVAGALRDLCSPDWKYTHIPLGEKRDIKTATKLKEMGAVAGWPDFILIDRNGRVHFLELKRRDAKTKKGSQQQLFHLWCVACGISYVIAHTIDQVLTAFEEWQCLKIDTRRK
jgi:hypothetical protein